MGGGSLVVIPSLHACRRHDASTAQARGAAPVPLHGGGGHALWLPSSPFLPCVRTPVVPPLGLARRVLSTGTVVWSVPHPLAAASPPCRFVLGGGGGGRFSPPPTCIPHPWRGGGVCGGGGAPLSSSLRSTHVASTTQAWRRHEARHLSLCRGGGLAVCHPSSPLLPFVRTPGGAEVCVGGGGGALVVVPSLHACRRHDASTKQARGEALGRSGGGGVSPLGLPALLHGIGSAPQDLQPLLPLGGSRHVSAWCSVSRACSLLCPYLLEEVRTRVETDDEEVRAAGRTYRTPRKLLAPSAALVEGREGDRETGGRRPCNQGRGAGQGERGRADRGQDRARGPGQRGGQRGSAASRIAPQCARASRRAEGQRWQGREGGNKVPHNRASRPQRAGALGKAGCRGVLPQGSPPPKVRCAVCLRSVMHRGPARTREEGTGRVKEVGHLGG